MTICSNPGCIGGMVEVDPVAYGELRWPYPTDPTPEQVADVDAKRARYSKNTYRPCGDCRPEQLVRWANGCYLPDHQAARCDLCTEAMGEKAARGHDRGAARR